MKNLWTTISVREMEKSLHFYSDILNLQIANRFKTPEGIEIVFLGSGETKLELICNENNRDIQHGKSVSTGFQVASVQEILERLASFSITPASPVVQPNPGMKFFFVEDPDGYRIQLVELLS